MPNYILGYSDLAWLIIIFPWVSVSSFFLFLFFVVVVLLLPESDARALCLVLCLTSVCTAILMPTVSHDDGYLMGAAIVLPKSFSACTHSCGSLR